MTVSSPALTSVRKKEEAMPRQFTEKDAIRNLQTYLRRLSYMDDDMINAPIDGIFEEKTRDAVRQFQRSNDLPVTGVADRQTWDAIYQAYLRELERIAMPDPIIPFPSYPADYRMKLGEESFLVSIVQHMLQELSTIYDTFDDVKINGRYDEVTANAIKDFQTRNSLAPTGEVDKATWNELSRIYNLVLHYIDQK